MPISCPITPLSLDKDEYHALDHKVMGIIFAVQNELGCLLDEKIYQRHIASRCRDNGLEATLEVPVTVSHKGFSKVYRIDLVVDNRVIYELKAVESIIARHRAQTLHYLLLTNFQYGKLVNLRPSSVESEFVTTSLTPGERHRIRLVTDSWRDLGNESTKLRNLLNELTADWGVFLDIQLYYDAIDFFFGGDDGIHRPVSLSKDGKTLGTQNLHLLTPDIAIQFSALKKSEGSYEKHLQRLLRLTSLQAIHWINFNRHVVQMKTLTREWSC